MTSSLPTLQNRLYSSGQEADVVVIGSGPGGYVAAIKAAQLGMNVSSHIVLRRSSVCGWGMLYPCLNYMIQGVFFHRFLVSATPKHISTTVVCAHHSESSVP